MTLIEEGILPKKIITSAGCNISLEILSGPLAVMAGKQKISPIIIKIITIISLLYAFHTHIIFYHNVVYRYPYVYDRVANTSNKIQYMPDLVLLYICTHTQ